MNPISSALLLLFLFSNFLLPALFLPPPSYTWKSSFFTPCRNKPTKLLLFLDKKGALWDRSNHLEKRIWPDQIFSFLKKKKREEATNRALLQIEPNCSWHFLHTLLGLCAQVQIEISLEKTPLEE